MDKPREISELDNTFVLVDSIVTKNYLTQLNTYSLCDTSKEFNETPVSEHASLFQVKKIVYDRNENNLQKLVNTYASMAGFGSDIVMIIHSSGKEVTLYLGTAGADDVSSARGSAEVFCSSLIGNFPGSIGDCNKNMLDSDGDGFSLTKLMGECTQKSYDGVSCVSGVGSPREQEDIANENYIQGIEKLIDTMQGIPFSAVFIANIISGEQLEDIKAEYELIYSKLIPFLKSELTFNESSSEGVSKTLSESLSKMVTKSKSSALSTGTSQSQSHTEGTAVAHIGNIGGNINVGVGNKVKVGGGMHYSHSISRSRSFSDTSTFGTTKSQTSTIGDAEAKSEIKGIAEGTSKTETTGRSLQITYTNKTVQNMLDRIDEQLERLKESETYGIFAAAAYFLAATPRDAKMAASAYKGLISGQCTHVERADINSWEDKANVEIIKKYLRKLKHPVFAFNAENTITPVSVVSGRELAVLFGLPGKSIPGVSVLETAGFGRNIESDHLGNNRYVELGNLYHMGREDEAGNGKIPVKLDVDSLTMHTFITGATGSGKSNAIYSLLEKVLEKKQAAFMVIEPAKGEYKDKFGNYEDVNVYGTNSKITQLLRINPFSFPKDIHVLEHIDRLIEIFNVCWPMYAAMPAVLKDAVERAYINAGWDLTQSECKYKSKFGQNIYPSFIDVLKMIHYVMAESEYSADNKGDYTGALCTRVKSLTNGIYGQIFTADELSPESLFDKNVIVDLSRIGSTETKSLIMGLLVMKLQEYRMCTHTGSNNQLKHLTVLEEAHNLLKRTSSDQSLDAANLTGKSVEMLANAIAEMRTYGEGFVIADQAPGLLDMAVIRNTNTKIILRLPDLSDRELVGRAASLNDSQIIELSRLKTGIAAVYQNDWLEPVLCHIHPCENEGKEKSRPKQEKKAKDEKDIKAEIIDYLMRPVPEKLKMDRNKVSQLKKLINKMQITSDTKIDLMRYFEEKTPKKIQRLRSKIIYNVFNSESAILMSNTERYDINSWYNMMLTKLEPNIESFERKEQDKILAIITSEYVEHVKTPESEEIMNELLKHVDCRESRR